MQIVMTKQIHNGGGTIALDSGMRQKRILFLQNIREEM